MKNFIPYSVAFSTFAATCLPTQAVDVNQSLGQQQTPQKNILFIGVDDLKPLLGCYGDTVAKTPNIDRLAVRGTTFMAAYCQQAVSAATRASLLTGMCPDRTKVWDLQTLIRSQNPDVVTLPQYFKENGYTVAGIGKIFDPRSVDKQNDTRSWSGEYLDFSGFVNPAYGSPIMGHYQSREVREQYDKYKEEAKAQGINVNKKNQLEQYIQKYVKPTAESVDIPDNAYNDGAIADGAIKFLSNYHLDQPFFLAVGFKKPHLPFCAPKKYWDLYRRDIMPLAVYRKKADGSPAFAYHKSNELQSYSDIPPIFSYSDIENAHIPDEKARELIHGYYACISYIDAQIGKLIDTLEKSGQLQNTIIVLWGDHGWHLGDHGLWNKHTNFEQATHVPFLVIDPASPTQKVETPVEYLSIFPTLCDLAGLKKPLNMDGESLAAVVKGGETSNVLKPYAVSQYPRVGKMGYSLRDSRYRYTVWVAWDDKNTDVNKVYAEELYDYEKDPNETVNVVKKEEYTKALQQMKVYWEEYKKNRIIGSERL